MPNAKLKIGGHLSQNPSVCLSYDFLPFFTGGLTNHINFLNPDLGFSFDLSDLNIELYDQETSLNTFSFKYTISNFNIF